MPWLVDRSTKRSESHMWPSRGLASTARWQSRTRVHRICPTSWRTASRKRLDASNYRKLVPTSRLACPSRHVRPSSYMAEPRSSCGQRPRDFGEVLERVRRPHDLARRSCRAPGAIAQDDLHARPDAGPSVLSEARVDTKGGGDGYKWVLIPLDDIGEYAERVGRPVPKVCQPPLTSVRQRPTLRRREVP